MKKKNYDGILRACEQALKTGNKTINLTCLWKYCQQEADIVHTVAFTKSALEEYFKGITVMIELSSENDIFAHIEGELRPSQVEKWIRTKLEHKNKDISFHLLQDYYKQEPLWLVKSKGFLQYIKQLLRKICEEMGNVVRFDINKHKQKVFVAYA